MKLLRQSTATTIVVGPIADSTDASAETGQTIAQANVLLWKEGGTTLAQKNDATTCTHRSNGLYTCPINTTDTNTLGKLIVNVAMSGTLVYRDDYTVVPASVYDAMVLGTDNLDVNTVQVGGTTQTARDLGASVLISSGTGTGQLSVTSGVIAANTTQIAGGAVNTSAAQLGVNVVNAGGTAWGSGAITAGSIASSAITDAKIASSAITDAKIATGAITASKFAAGAIDATAVAADAIGASELATDAVTEIVNAILAATVETRANASINLAAALRILIAVAAGQRTDNTYLSPDGTANRVEGTVSGGDRTAITVTTTT